MTRASLSSAIIVAILLWMPNANTFAYPTKYGPFKAGQSPTTASRTECALVKQQTLTEDSTVGASRLYRAAIVNARASQPTVNLLGSEDGWIINVFDANGKNLMPVPATNHMTSSEMEVFSCDLNHDGQPDFILNIWSGGCGLAAEGSEVTFLLSSKDGYRATSFYLTDFGAEDLVQFKAGGPVYLILNDLTSNDGQKTSDGRDHNFWVYSLRRIDGTEFIKADVDQAGFPKWVWYSFKENHSETTLLTPEQKAVLIKNLKNDL